MTIICVPITTDAARDLAIFIQGKLEDVTSLCSSSLEFLHRSQGNISFATTSDYDDLFCTACGLRGSLRNFLSKIMEINRIILVYYCKCCNLIGYTLLAIYSSIDRSSKTIIFLAHIFFKNSIQLAFSMFFNLGNILCLIFDSTKTTRLLVLDFLR